MPTYDKHLLEMRAESLAMVYLTRQEDLSVKLETDSDRFDVLVSLMEDGRKSGRFFGVKVEGVVSEQDLHRKKVDRTLTITRSDEDGYRDFPICLFVFVMLGDQGYWKWLQQPVSHGQQRELALNTDPTLRPLDNKEPQKVEELTTIINAVNDWYDSRRALVAA